MDEELIEIALLLATVPSETLRSYFKMLMKHWVDEFVCDVIVWEDKWDQWCEGKVVKQQGERIVVIDDEAVYVCEKRNGFYRCRKV